MDKLNFFIVDLNYISYLKQAEQGIRGFSRIPNMNYGNNHKPKFLCGVILQMNGLDYYVPVSSYKTQKPDNFLIRADNGQVVGSLRFNYMFPIPAGCVTERTIATEPDQAYRSLLAQELKYCNKNRETIQKLANRTYKRVLLGKDPGLLVNSCAFKLLEEKCAVYAHNQQIFNEFKSRETATKKESLQDKINAAEKRKNNLLEFPQKQGRKICYEK